MNRLKAAVEAAKAAGVRVELWKADLATGWNITLSGAAKGQLIGTTYQNLAQRVLEYAGQQLIRASDETRRHGEELLEQAVGA